MTDTTFNKRFNAQRAARRALSDMRAQEGRDFLTSKQGDAWVIQYLGEPAKGFIDEAGAKEAEAKARRGARTKPKSAKVHNLAAEREARKGGKKVRKIKPKGQEPKFRKQSHKAAFDAAQNGVLPEPPDMSASTHAPFLKKLRRIIDLAERSDLKGLMADTMEPKSSSRAMIVRYRNLCIQALKVQQADGRPMMEMSQAEWEQRQIAAAIEFTASKFKGRGAYDTRRFQTLEQAGRGAYEMGDGTIIYAITAKGRQVMVGGIRKGAFEPTDAARELASSVRAA